MHNLPNNCKYIEQFLSEEEAQVGFKQLRKLFFQKQNENITDVGRQITVQGIPLSENGDIKYPLYRVPGEDQKISCRKMDNFVENWARKIQTHFRLPEIPNCAFIQLYRLEDGIKQHCDKTLDIKPDTFIFNLSFGQKRTFILRKKCQKNGKTDDIKFPLQSGSLFALDLQTNDQYFHFINPEQDINEKENIFQNIRIRFLAIDYKNASKISDELIQCKLYYVQNSIPNKFVELTLVYLGIPFKQQKIKVMQGETKQKSFLEINPRGKTPVLEIQYQNQFLRLFQSLPINIYLIEKTEDQTLIPISLGSGGSSISSFGIIGFLVILYIILQLTQNRQKEKSLTEKELAHKNFNNNSNNNQNPPSPQI
ncbi:Thioredoxin-like fold [Pseudocohnilembus persalinus]|uniref:Thioredoxin-like fold n=1 Tax=Pseudocohnilembus persalinus TaxID=266149 RepID=A0A0V0QQI7_PSEPJ|nr:Thioredoxin-like fold [Pseudocohnilembus persalinus]|eukprot:KRX04288.1 Thioredoxin-like fold [Pseudocohnilembus persalinus]